jgi:hypothetical protein
MPTAAAKQPREKKPEEGPRPRLSALNWKPDKKSRLSYLVGGLVVAASIISFCVYWFV